MCNMSENYSSQGILKKHISAVHDGIKPFKCEICCSNFAFNAGLRIHIATVYEGKRPNECIICDAKFTRKADLKFILMQFMKKKIHV